MTRLSLLTADLHPSQSSLTRTSNACMQALLVVKLSSWQKLSGHELRCQGRKHRLHHLSMRSRRQMTVWSQSGVLASTSTRALPPIIAHRCHVWFQLAEAYTN